MLSICEKTPLQVFRDAAFQINSRFGAGITKPLNTDEIILIDFNYETIYLRPDFQEHTKIAELAELIDSLGAKQIILDMEVDFDPGEDTRYTSWQFLSKCKSLILTGLYLGDSRNNLMNRSTTPIQKFSIGIDPEYISGNDLASYSLPLPEYLTACSGFGFVNSIYQGSTFIGCPLFLKKSGYVFPSAFLSSIINSLEIKTDQITINSKQVSLNSHFEIPSEDGLMRYYPMMNTNFSTIPAYKAFSLTEKSVAGKTVILGRSLLGRDYHFTITGKQVWGTEILASLILQIKQKRFLSRSHFIFTFLFSILFTYLILSIPKKYCSISFLLVVLISFFIGALFYSLGKILPSDTIVLSTWIGTALNQWFKKLPLNKE